MKHPRRAWQLRWGATDDEVEAALPGDGLITAPDLTATRAITIHAPAALIWPWLAQLGQGRGGFYTCDWAGESARSRPAQCGSRRPPVAGHPGRGHDQAGRRCGATRLLARERYAYTRRWAPLILEPVQLISFAMTQRMLRGIKERAERSAPSK